ncbi:ferredoxin [Streptomyces sp. NPDC058045]|uniref:ferredoxin n=1 Tax=Streptomyces sp. NPDC058045 TaxID=3346311 RepID=UPI0036E3F738
MRIRIDRGRCAGLGMCESFAPELFQVQGDGTLLVTDETPDPSLRDAVQGAVDNCPVEAISLLEEE